jgi:hypothetical protein
MPRRTRLALIAQQPTEGDERLVSDVFPAPPPVAPNSQLADDVLTILRRETDRALSLAGQASSIASTALDTAHRAAADTTAVAGTAETLQRRTDAIETETRQIGERAMAVIAEHAQQQVAGRAVALATVAQQVLAILIQSLVYFVDRAPVLLALGAAVWLWSQVLADPSELRLVGLGLFGLLVIGPAMWLSARRHGGPPHAG